VEKVKAEVRNEGVVIWPRVKRMTEASSVIITKTSRERTRSASARSKVKERSRI
jgi:hypothetical protein